MATTGEWVSFPLDPDIWDHNGHATRKLTRGEQSIMDMVDGDERHVRVADDSGLDAVWTDGGWKDVDEGCEIDDVIAVWVPR